MTMLIGNLYEEDNVSFADVYAVFFIYIITCRLHTLKIKHINIFILGYLVVVLTGINSMAEGVLHFGIYITSQVEKKSA